MSNINLCAMQKNSAKEVWIRKIYTKSDKALQIVPFGMQKPGNRLFICYYTGMKLSALHCG